MKVIVGLGNPGEIYKNNRHNVGFMVVDKLAASRQRSAVSWQQAAIRWESKFESLIWKTDEVLLVKPQTYMNRSGEAVAEIVNFYKIPLVDLIVVHDDLDIRLGEYKLQMGIGPKVHNGVNSIEEKLGKDFWRMRIGVDNRREEARIPGEEYVLADFTEEEKDLIGVVVNKVAEELKG